MYPRCARPSIPLLHPLRSSLCTTSLCQLYCAFSPLPAPSSSDRLGLRGGRCWGYTTTTTQQQLYGPPAHFPNVFMERGVFK